MHLLSKLQAEGWGIASVEHSVDYARITPKGPKLPIGATLVVKLTPER
jgi:hypothetical protein